MTDTTNLATERAAALAGLATYLGDSEANLSAHEQLLAALQNNTAAIQERIAADELTIAAQAGRITTLEQKVIALATPDLPPIPVPVKTLLFAEDFLAPLDLKKWDVKARTTKSGTIFDASHYKVQNGMLYIWADKDAAGVWHAAEIQSLAPTYAYLGPRYMESIAQFPGGYGTWPAPIWEWNAPWGGLGIENDVCEQLGKDALGTYHVTVHDSQGHAFGKIVNTGVDLSAGLHAYASAVYADHIDYYFDRVRKQTITKVEAFAAGLVDWHYVDTSMVVICDLDMGGTWAGTPTIPGPAQMAVGEIKVWAL